MTYNVFKWDVKPYSLDPSANLECMSEMWCARLAGNAEPKNRQKVAIYGYHRTTLSGYIFARHIDNRKKTC